MVKAWVEISDTDSDSDDKQQQKTMSAHTKRESPADCSELWTQQTPLRIHMLDTGHVIVRPYNQDEVKRLRNVFSGSARFIGKLQQKRTRSKFQFQKYITYLEKVSRNVGGRASDLGPSFYRIFLLDLFDCVVCSGFHIWEDKEHYFNIDKATAQ